MIEGERYREIKEIIIITISILNILEINILYNILYFIIIVITIGYILYIENILYISMILIIVYSTALVILFGFIIMKKKRYIPISLSNNTPYYIILLVLSISSISYYHLDDNIFPCAFPSPSGGDLPTGGGEGYMEGYNVYRIELIKRIGEILYMDNIYSYIVIISGILLLTPILAIVRKE